MGKYDILISPIEIAPGFVLKNRIVKAPQNSFGWNADGTADGCAAIPFYESMAKGGASCIIVGGLAWEYAPHTLFMDAYDDKFLPGMKELVDAVHKHDCKIIGQLNHRGPATAVPGRDRPISASTLEAKDSPFPSPMALATRGLTVDEIHDKQEAIANAAQRMWKAGFDGVDIHSAHGYFLNSFLSPIWNKRTDEYGWDTAESRTRIVTEIYATIRKLTDDHFLIGSRINGMEFSPLTPGITPEIAAENAQALVGGGAQFINVSAYGYGPLPILYTADYFPYPEPSEFMTKYMDAYKNKGILNEGTRAVKAAVKVPVFTAGRMDEDIAERVLEDGDADVVCFGRQMWADPEFANKIIEGKTDEIMHCTRCATCEDYKTGVRHCRVNPALGREREIVPAPTSTPKHIMVVGGGPAGMECALTAAARGHKVTLYEKNSELGGRTKLAAMIKSGTPEKMMPIHDCLVVKVKKSNITLKLRTEVTPELIKKEKPDAVVLATGSPYLVPNIPGINVKNVFSIPGLSTLSQFPMKMFGPDKLASLSKRFFPIGKKLVIWGAGAEGAQCAEFMIKRGKEVTLIAENDDIGGLIPTKYKQRIEPWLKDKNAIILRNATVLSFDKRGARIKQENGMESTIPCDSMLVMLPEYHDSTFYNQVKDLAAEVYEIGSTLGGDNVFMKDAFLDGYDLGCRL